jgi:RNA polymerase sigma factor (TIGR02999 family)
MLSSSHELTLNLIEWRNGNAEAINKILPVVYEELKRTARRYLRRERGDISIQTTELINEAYIKLVEQRESDWQNRAHFFAVAARVMRNLLIDYARSKQFAKRDGRKIAFDKIQIASPETAVNLLSLNEALNNLARIDERKSHIVELRFFGGLSAGETAQVLGIAEVTVKREWLKAKAWLYQELSTTEKDE